MQREPGVRRRRRRSVSRVFAEGGDYTQAVIEVVAAIPPGSVMTYGDVAWTFGHPGARAVGMVMRFHGSGLPWWRVVRAGGSPARARHGRAGRSGAVTVLRRA